jgi:aminoglycoside phosphotransferase (APT) family kinase protein
LREWRIVQALDGSDVPHTPAVGVCEDASVLGRPFYLMGFIDGWSPMGLVDKRWPEPFDTDREARTGLGYQLAEGIALLAKVDWRARGLEGLGRPENFHERQVDRWTSFFERIKIRELEGMDVASAWLHAHKPIDYIPGIMHGDYQFANVMFEHGAPAQLAAIVDWEMGTVGDPKLDLGWMVQGWPEDTSSPDAATSGYVNMQGMPSRDQVVAYYAEVSGRQVEDLDYYVILAKWKLAIVLERGFARADDDEKLLAFGPIIVGLMKGAAELAESTAYGR